jgi:hypothetical protein
VPGPDPEPRCHIGTWPARRGRRSWPICGWTPDFSAAARCPKRTVPETTGRGRQQRSGHRRQPRSDRWRQPRSGRGQRRPRITTSGRRPRSGCERRPKGDCGRRRPRSGGRGAWPSSVTEEQWPRSERASHGASERPRAPPQNRENAKDTLTGARMSETSLSRFHRASFCRLDWTVLYCTGKSAYILPQAPRARS